LHIAATAVLEKANANAGLEKAEEEPEELFEDAAGEDEIVGLTTKQVEEFLGVLCDDTKIAEVELKMGSFELKVRRSLKEGALANEPSAATVAAAATALPAAEATPAPVLEPRQAFPSMDEDDMDESLVYIGSPKVGVMRRGRYVKGKKVGKGPVAEPGSRVKKGQPLCYIEQLGTFVPVEAPQAGELREFLVEESDPVEYNQPLVELMPFFGGHIIGDSKHA